jgi:hypothetical protein
MRPFSPTMRASNSNVTLSSDPDTQSKEPVHPRPSHSNDKIASPGSPQKPAKPAKIKISPLNPPNVFFMQMGNFHQYNRLATPPRTRKRPFRRVCYRIFAHKSSVFSSKLSPFYPFSQPSQVRSRRLPPTRYHEKSPPACNKRPRPWSLLVKEQGGAPWNSR